MRYSTLATGVLGLFWVLKIAVAGDATIDPAACLLSPPAAKTHAALIEAAEARDAAALATLTHPEGYYLTFEAGGDIVAEIAAYERTGMDIYAVLTSLLNSPCETVTTEQGASYEWPNFVNKSPAELTDEQRDLIKTLHGGEPEDYFLDGEYYVGWRATINEEGKWEFLVNGD